MSHANGRLTLSPPDTAQQPTDWVEIEPLVFQRVDEETLISFQEDARGTITHLFIGTNAFDKLAWYETVAFQWNFIGISMLVFLLGSLGWPLGEFLRRVLNRPNGTPSAARSARVAAWLVCLLALISLLLSLPVLQGGPLANWLGIQKLVYGAPILVVILLWINLITTGLTLGLVIFTVLAWKHRYWTFLGRCRYSVITLVALMRIPFLVYWNRLGFYT